jgi:hypothetical protein
MEIDSLIMTDEISEEDLLDLICFKDESGPCHNCDIYIKKKN